MKATVSCVVGWDIVGRRTSHELSTDHAGSPRPLGFQPQAPVTVMSGYPRKPWESFLLRASSSQIPLSSIVNGADAFFFLVFLGLYLRHMEVPRLWSLAAHSEVAVPRPQWFIRIGPIVAARLHHSHSNVGSNRICDPYHSSCQLWILNPLSKAKDQTCILMDTSQICFRWATTGTPADASLLWAATLDVIQEPLPGPPLLLTAHMWCPKQSSEEPQGLAPACLASILPSNIPLNPGTFLTPCFHRHCPLFHPENLPCHLSPLKSYLSLKSSLPILSSQHLSWLNPLSHWLPGWK